ncbi:MAG: cytochrome C biogenesis protein [Fluviicola sp.]|nr:MAG: cytochrome C biogenesis protein [Fluviicola sp.]
MLKIKNFPINARLIRILFSIKLTTVLFLLFGTVMAIATFIENSYGTQSAQALIYHAWWFQIIFVVFVLNFIGNIKRYGLLKKGNLSTLAFHLGFILIIIGAGVTHFFSYEGVMIIKEGERKSFMQSEKAYVSIIVDNQLNKKEINEHFLFVPDMSKKTGALSYCASFLDWVRGGNDFTINSSFDGTPFSIEYVDYVPNAKIEFAKSNRGKKHIHIVETSGTIRSDHYVGAGETLSLDQIDFSFEGEIIHGISLYEIDKVLFINSAYPLPYTVMDTKKNGVVKSNVETPLLSRALYSFDNLKFIIPDGIVSGEIEYVSDDPEYYPSDMLKLNILTPHENSMLMIMQSAREARFQTKQLEGLNFSVAYGPKQIPLPFSIKLEDFKLEHYPGSNSPKSFTSKVLVDDKKSPFTFSISSNNVLDYKGYRFFQASYNDAGTVKETLLSVNHDWLGTWLSYAGYALLFFGLIAMLFAPNSHFQQQRKRLKRMTNKQAMLFFIFFTSFSNLFGQESLHSQKLNMSSLSSELFIASTKRFERLVIQDDEGRMKPINTFGSELLRKISKKNQFQEISSSQFIHSIFLTPKVWENVEIIYIKKENTKLRRKLGVPINQKYVRLSDFFTVDKSYKLEKDVTKAYKKKIRTKYEQSVLDVDRRVALMYLVIRGDLFSLLPIKNNKENKWISAWEVSERGYEAKDLVEMELLISSYKLYAIEWMETGDTQKIDNIFSKLEAFQKNNGARVRPSDRKIELELFYNKYDIFKNLFWQYLLVSVALFIVVFVQIFVKKSKIVNGFVKMMKGAVVLLFIYHTFGLILRWYISEHAPWSNGYESMIYVAWASLLFGIIIGRKSGLTLAATTFVTSIILMVAHWNWMDPTIGNLQPVLDSYWLMIHVAIIIASYGPFIIGMILGMINLMLFSLTRESNKERMNAIIKELTLISQLSLTIGLVMLTIGNFLGGIWANESWGRYWGWDPKETWALISIMVYAFIIHLRLIPKLRSNLIFNSAAALAFSSILMTYLGVNHLLSGLHSYAAGKSAPIPIEIWTWFTLVILLILFATIKQNKYNLSDN